MHGRTKSQIGTVAMCMKIKIRGGRNRAALFNGAARNDGHQGFCTAL